MADDAPTTVASLTEGQKVRGTFLCKRKVSLSDRNGREYMSLVLADSTAEVEAMLWEKAEEQGRKFEEGEVVTVAGKMNRFQGRLQLHILTISQAAEGARPLEELIPTGPHSTHELQAELEAMLTGLGDGHLKALAQAYLDDEPFMMLMIKAPAARRIHHAYNGGLLEHTVSVMRLANQICDHYEVAIPELLNRDICIMGAFLHDLGKVHELSSKGGMDYTTEGRLLGHLLLGMRMLDEKIAALPDFPEALAHHIRHGVASHHGRLEHGSPKRPKTVEAIVVHRADELDSTLANLRDIFKQAGTSDWTAFQTQYNRYLYLGKPGG